VAARKPITSRGLRVFADQIGAVASVHPAIPAPQIFRQEAENRRQDSHQSPNTAGNRTAFPRLIDRFERLDSISQEVLRRVISKIA
jgi:hypothetical protein